MNELIKLLTSSKGTAGNRSAVLVLLGWLAWQQVETNKVLTFLREHRCRCAGHEQNYSAAPSTNNFARLAP